MRYHSAEANERLQPDHLGVDTMAFKGHSGYPVTATNRCARRTWVCLVTNRTAAAVTKALVATLRPDKARLSTIISDNGGEFAWHRTIARELGVDFHFADPYASWKRGKNENTNGLLQQRFSRSLPFSAATRQQVAGAVRSC